MVQKVKEPKEAKQPVDQMVLANGDPLPAEQPAAQTAPETKAAPQPEDERRNLHLRLEPMLKAKVVSHCILTGIDVNAYLVELIQKAVGGYSISRRSPKQPEPLKIA